MRSIRSRTHPRDSRPRPTYPTSIPIWAVSPDGKAIKRRSISLRKYSGRTADRVCPIMQCALRVVDLYDPGGVCMKQRTHDQWLDALGIENPHKQMEKCIREIGIMGLRRIQEQVMDIEFENDPFIVV